MTTGDTSVMKTQAVGCWRFQVTKPGVEEFAPNKRALENILWRNWPVSVMSTPEVLFFLSGVTCEDKLWDLTDS